MFTWLEAPQKFSETQASDELKTIRLDFPGGLATYLVSLLPWVRFSHWPGELLNATGRAKNPPTFRLGYGDNAHLSEALILTAVLPVQGYCEKQ